MRKVTKTFIIWIFLGSASLLLTRRLIMSGQQTDFNMRALARDLVFPNNSHQVSHTSNTTVINIRMKTKTTITDGYNLAKRIHDYCNKTSYKPTESVFGVYTASTIQTCTIWKIGTTFLKRIYMMKQVVSFHNLINPYDIPFNKRHLPQSKISNSPSQSRFMFVRDPYNRLLSGFVDKLMAPNPVYWQLIGLPAIRLSRQRTSTNTKSFKCGHDLTFKEYISYVISTLAPKPGGKRGRPDGHFDRMTSLCKPCAVDYNFVGKMESFNVDSLELARSLKMQNQTIRLLETVGYKYAWLDAVKDSAHQPFDKEFVKGYNSCISFYQALQRSWEKMQIRGLIGKEEFPMTEGEVGNLTEEQFVNMAVKSRESSSSEERHKLKEGYFIEMFQTISTEDLERITKIYADDFKLFEYDDRPALIFNGR